MTDVMGHTLRGASAALHTAVSFKRPRAATSKSGNLSRGGACHSCAGATDGGKCGIAS